MTRTLFTPMFSTILRDRRLASLIATAALIQVLLAFFGFPGWPCPVLHTFGIPCPGCGITRAMLLLGQGHWKQSLTMHAFAPVFLITLLMVTMSALVPKGFGARTANAAEAFEERTGIGSIVLIALIVYWLIRLLVMPVTITQMIQG